MEKKPDVFIHQVREVAHNWHGLLDDKKGYVILAVSDSEKDADRHQAVVSAGGSEKTIVQSLVNMFREPSMQPMIEKALTIVALHLVASPLNKHHAVRSEERS